MKRRLATACVLVPLWCSACGEAVVRSGRPAGAVAPLYDERWHDSFFFGTLDPAEAAPLSTICPQGWSEIRASSTFLAGLLQWSTLGIYTPTTVTVVCSAPSGVYIGAPSEVPLAPLCR